MSDSDPTSHTDPSQQLGEPPASVLEGLVFEFLERVESEGPPVLEELCERHPEYARALRTRVSALRAAGLLDESGADEEPFPESLGPFHLVRRLGSGGMGVVYAAEERELGRTVALKLVRPDQLYFSGARERFRREVEAAARLTHPGIAAVYSVGEERGLPYYAMELVPGASLADGLATLGGRDLATLRGADLFDAIVSHLGENDAASLPPEPGPVFSGTWVETIERIVRQVAEALEHAHRRGVVHRDVKPSNIIVTPEGRALLVDFGLSTREGSARLTRTGAVSGTVGYMSPEILSGQTTEAGPGTDVYSLGVTLYELLTLHLPYDASSLTALQSKVLEGRPERPRHWNRALGVDAETVCLVAMDVDPARRYATAEAFARDLTHVLEKQPIEARPLGSWLMLKRWAQRNPSRAFAVALVLFVVVVGPLAFGIQQSLARQRLDVAYAKLGTALSNEETERARAERNLDRALDAVDEMLVHVGEERLENVPMMQQVRRELLELAALFYDELLPQRPGDEGRIAARGRIARSRGDVLRLLGESASSESAFREQLETFERLLASRPGDASYRWHIAGCQNQLGRILREKGDHTGALTTFREAREALSVLSLENIEVEPGAAQVLEDLSLVQTNVSLVLMDGGEIPAALQAATEAVEAAEALSAEFPNSDGRRALAAALSARGILLHYSGRPKEACDVLSQEFELLGALMQSDPTQVEIREQLVQAAATYGGVLWTSARQAEAEEVLRIGYEAGQELVDEYPSVTVYLETLVRVAVNYGSLLGSLEELERAREPLEHAAELAEQLYSRDPAQPALRELYGKTLMTCGSLAVGLGDYEAGIEYHFRSVEILRTALAAAPMQVQLRRSLCHGLCNIAETRLLQGDANAADAILAEVVESCPNDPISLRALAGIWAGCAEAVRVDGGDETQVGTYLDAALDALERAVANGHRDPLDLRNAERLAPLRGRPQFDALVRSLESGG